MKILVPITLDRWRHSIAPALRETCIRIDDMSFYSFSNPASQEDRELGSAVWARPNMHQLSSWDVLTERFDVVHHGSATNKNLAASILARLIGAGRCTHVYTAQVEPYRQDPWYWHYRCCTLLAQRVTAVSTAVADALKREFGRKVDNIIPNGADFNFFSTAAAHRVELEALSIRAPYVMFVAHLEDRKRPDIFIELAKRMPDVDFVMLGGHTHVRPAERRPYLRAIEQQSNIKFLGLQSRALVRDLFARSIALIFPSETEGFPLTVVEAHAMGLPVLAQNKSCMPEIIEQDVNGWILPADNLDLWEVKLREILSWSDAGRAHFAEGVRRGAYKYSWDVIAPQYREIYLATN